MKAEKIQWTFVERTTIASIPNHLLPNIRNADRAIILWRFKIPYARDKLKNSDPVGEE